MTAMRTVLVNDRWSLKMPEHRAARPEWPWWEATRLAAMFHAIVGQQAELEVRGSMRRPVVVDVGAEEGDLPGLWSSWGCDVIMAEPNPRVWPNIEAIWEANQLRDPLGCWAGFVGHEIHEPDGGHAEWTTVAGWPASASGPVIGDHGFCQLGERPDLPTVTLDELVARVGNAHQTDLPVDVITMDVEGSELHVLQGATETLRAQRPHVFVSIHPAFMAHHYGIDHGTTVVREFMAEAGYPWDRHVHLCTDHEEHWWFQP